MAVKGEDIFFKITKKIEQFFLKNIKIILLSISTIIIILAAYFSVNYFIMKKEDQAEDAFGKVYLVYREIMNLETEDEDEIKQKLLSLNEDFKIVINKYPKSAAASKSAYFIGNTFYGSKEYENALVYYQKGSMIKTKYYNALLCLQGEASSYEQIGKYEKAEEVYKNIVDNYENSFVIPAVRFNLGQIYEKLNKIEAAKEEYSIIISEYSWSSWSDLAEKKILFLKSTG